MKELGRVVAWLPIRAESSRIPRKNFLRVKSPEYPNGEALWERIIRIVHSCLCVDEIVVDTDSPQIRNLLEGCSGRGPVQFKERKGMSNMHAKITVIERDPSLLEATASIGMYNTRNRLIEQHGDGFADVWIHTHACAPMLTAHRIEQALRLMAAHPYLDSVFAAVPVDGYWFWMNGKPLYDLKSFPRTQEWPDQLIRETNTLYVIKDSALLATQQKIGLRSLPVMVDESESVDVNGLDDLEGFDVEPES